MKNIFYILLLLPTIIFAQYPSNSGQKITLGEQTTADGLVFRGVAADTTRKPSVDTMAFILLDTNTNIIWQYKKAVNNAWTRVGGSISSGVTGTLPVANGGTGLTTFTAENRIPYSTSATDLATSSNLTFDGTKLILSGNQSFTGTQSFRNISINSTYTQTTATNAGVVGAFNSLLTYAGTQAFSNSTAYSVIPNVTNTNTDNLISGAYYSLRTGSAGAANILNSMRSEYRLSGSGNVTEARAISGLIFKDGSGNLTNGYGLKIEDITNTAGTITNTYAIHVGDITSGTQTTKAYSLFISDQNSRSYINSNTGLGVLNPTARLHLAAGTATAGTAPLKFTSGVALTTPEVGAMEFSNISGTNRLLISPADNVRKEIAYTDFSNASGTLAVANGGTNRTTMPAGYILHGDGTSVDTAVGLFWDRTNGELGIGTNNPAAQLNVFDLTKDATILINGTSAFEQNFHFFNSAFGITKVKSADQLDLKSTNRFTFKTGAAGSQVERIRITPTGMAINLFTVNPTAYLTLGAGTATASTAPLKFTSGTKLAVPESGAMEFTADTLFFSTTNLGRKNIAYTDFSNTTGTLPVANGGTGSTSYISGAIPYSNGTSLTSDTSKIFFDNTNKRLGINTSVPEASFDLRKGNGAIFEVEFTASAGGKGVQFIDSDDNLSKIQIGSGVSADNAFLPVMLAVRSVNQSVSPGVGIFYETHVNNFIDSLIYNTAGATYIVSKNNGSSIVPVTEMNLFVVRNQNLTRFTITYDGRVGLVNQVPTARLHIPAGTNVLAPLKFNSGTLLNTPEAGSMEFLNTNLYFTPNSNVRHNVNHGLTGSATLNFPSTTTLLSADLTITVTGAADGDVVSLGVPNAAVNANTSYSAWVSAANTVTVRFNNYSSGTVDPASGLFKVFVTK